jgi:hypothetical protein
LPTEVECGDQTVVSPGDFEAHAITIKHLRVRPETSGRIA